MKYRSLSLSLSLSSTYTIFKSIFGISFDSFDFPHISLDFIHYENAECTARRLYFSTNFDVYIWIIRSGNHKISCQTYRPITMRRYKIFETYFIVNIMCAAQTWAAAILLCSHIHCAVQAFLLCTFNVLWARQSSWLFRFFLFTNLFYSFFVRRITCGWTDTSLDI